MAPADTPPPSSPKVYRFDRFALDLAQRALFADGDRIDLGARAFELLHTLVQRPERVLEKAELLALAWPGITVDENNLHVQISALRRVLGAGLITTIPGRGYQFTASVVAGEIKTAAPVSPPSAANSIAVLAFVDMSETGDQQFFADGIAEEITNALGKVSGLQVAGRSSAFIFRGANLDLREVGDALNVAHILEGSIRRQRNRVRITAHLVRAADRTLLWSQSFDGALDDIFDLQEAIARAIVAELGLMLGVARHSRLIERLTPSGEAHDLLLQARAAYRSSPSEHTFAITMSMLERAVALDPEFVAAWIEIATVNNFATGYLRGRSRKAAFEASRAAVARALTINPQSPKARIWEANIRYFEGDLVRAYRLALDALSDAPDDEGIVFSVGHYSAMFGYSSLALPHLEKATRTDPFDGFAWTTQALICQNLCRYEEAEAFGTRAAVLGEFAAHEVLAWNAALKRDPDLACARYLKFCESAANAASAPGRRARWEAIARAYFRDSESDAAPLREDLRRKAQAPDFEPDARSINMAAKLGLGEQVFAQWKGVFAGKSALAVAIWSDAPWARALRAHEQFPAFLAREGFIDVWQAFGWPEAYRPLSAAQTGDVTASVG